MPGKPYFQPLSFWNAASLPLTNMSSMSSYVISVKLPSHLSLLGTLNSGDLKRAGLG
ncbi:hypothetical protein [Pyrobaculum ferrireducens]|uniref:hypothetical protein n=1 Tax=Pyrobaculum ferrireducens TaxID=1104324 RepID=UPI0013050900|nr:hypothetical protein [Pyrobaculum ferrireducens]